MYKIMIVDDEPSILLSLSYALKAEGVEVIACNEIEQAEEALENTRFDLVIADLATAERGWVNVLKRAKGLNLEVKIMVLSGNHEVTFPREAYQIEVDDYILMPVSPTELWRRVSPCLESLEIVDLVPVER